VNSGAPVDEPAAPPAGGASSPGLGPAVKEGGDPSVAVNSGGLLYARMASPVVSDACQPLAVPAFWRAAGECACDSGVAWKPTNDRTAGWLPAREVSIEPCTRQMPTAGRASLCASCRSMKHVECVISDVSSFFVKPSSMQTSAGGE